MELVEENSPAPMLKINQQTPSTINLSWDKRDTLSPEGETIDSQKPKGSQCEIQLAEEGEEEEDTQNQPSNQSEQQPDLVHPCLNSLPQPIRYLISGTLGNAFFYLLDKLVEELDPFEWQSITVAWFISYVISIAIQYFLHEWIVFGKNDNRARAIVACYISYSLGIVLSVGINYALTNYLLFSNDPAWLLTLLITGFINYITVTAVMQRKTKEHLKSAEKHN